jgi:hypothetical protein
MYPPSTPEPELRTTPESEPAQRNQGARLAELLARADQAAQRIAVQEAERQAGSQYAARMELEAQAGAGQEPEAREELELELSPRSVWTAFRICPVTVTKPMAWSSQSNRILAIAPRDLHPPCRLCAYDGAVDRPHVGAQNTEL